MMVSATPTSPASSGLDLIKPTDPAAPKSEKKTDAKTAKGETEAAAEFAALIANPATSSNVTLTATQAPAKPATNSAPASKISNNVGIPATVPNEAVKLTPSNQVTSDVVGVPAAKAPLTPKVPGAPIPQIPTDLPTRNLPASATPVLAAGGKTISPSKVKSTPIEGAQAPTHKAALSAQSLPTELNSNSISDIYLGAEHSAQGPIASAPTDSIFVTGAEAPAKITPAAAPMISGSEFMQIKNQPDVISAASPAAFAAPSERSSSGPKDAGTEWDGAPGTLNRRNLPKTVSLEQQPSLYGTEAILAPAPALAARPAGQKAHRENLVGHVTLGSMATERLSSQSVMDVSTGIQRLTITGGGEMNIKLHPESLGELQVRVSTVGNRVGLRIQASNERAQKILQESLPFLREKLASQKMNLSKVDVVVGHPKAAAPGTMAASNTVADSFADQTGLGLSALSNAAPQSTSSGFQMNSQTNTAQDSGNWNFNNFDFNSGSSGGNSANWERAQGQEWLGETTRGGSSSNVSSQNVGYRAPATSNRRLDVRG